MPSLVWFAVHDKLVHLGLYFVLGAALSWGKLKSPFGTHHGLAVGAGFAYGAVDEWHQSFVPYRYPSLGDFAADVGGVVVGYLFVLAAMSLVRHRALGSA